ncbi:hypothetical protein V865_003265 [Kwoniella europaea PYCC6329]|uniref:Cupin type-1 domain-containing protein n=1 Tax=Kwoniella europaea PYCC6329 TaxID=1423913 RepID=A0AAX4KFA5_9TREE
MSNSFFNSSFPSHPHPVLKADDIDKSMFPMPHWRNPNALRKTTCLSDKVGMANTGVAVHKSSIGPGMESTAIHYHLSNTEWIYILSGSAILQLVDASLPILNPFQPASSGPEDGEGRLYRFSWRGGSGVTHYPLANASDIWERSKDGKFTVASAPNGSQ